MLDEQRKNSLEGQHAETEKNLHITPNSQRLIDNLVIDEALKYDTWALVDELQALSNSMDKDWSF